MLALAVAMGRTSTFQKYEAIEYALPESTLGTINERLYKTQMGGGCTHDFACRSHTIIDLAFPQSRDGARLVLAGRDSQPRAKREEQLRVRRAHQV